VLCVCMRIFKNHLSLSKKEAQLVQEEEEKHDRSSAAETNLEKCESRNTPQSASTHLQAIFTYLQHQTIRQQ